MKKTGRPALPLFERWPAVSRRLRKAKHVLLLLDFDGTLVDFKPRPEDVRLDHLTRQLLSRLARHPRISLGFISGRRRSDLRRHVGVPRAHYWGLHGWEDRAGKRLSSEARKQLFRARKLLTEKVRGLKGVWVEDKQASFVLHFREARDARRACAAARYALNSSGRQLRMLEGKKIRELLAAEVKGKGATVEKLAAGLPTGTLIIYVGDDATDESAFAALRQALTIHVGRSPCTQARYCLDNPGEVRKFLERLEEAVALVSPTCGVRWTPSESRNRTPPRAERVPHLLLDVGIVSRHGFSRAVISKPKRWAALAADAREQGQNPHHSDARHQDNSRDCKPHELGG